MKRIDQVLASVHRSKLIEGFGTPILCYFCGEEVNQLEGRDPESLAIHSLDGNHENWDPSNKVSAHLKCHTSFHVSQPQPTKNLTDLRYKLLTTVERLCTNQPLGCVSPAEIEGVLKWGGVDKTREMMKVLQGEGWLMRPYRACYKLSEEGRQMLEGVKKRRDAKK